MIKIIRKILVQEKSVWNYMPRLFNTYIKFFLKQLNLPEKSLFSVVGCSVVVNGSVTAGVVVMGHRAEIIVYNGISLYDLY